MLLLAPVRNGAEPDLQAALTRLDATPAPAALRAHVVRAVVVGAPVWSARPEQRDPRRYLLLTAVTDSRPEDFLDALSALATPVTGELGQWLAGLPSSPDPPTLRAYLERHRIPAQQRFRAVDRTVDGVRSALTLRQRHLELARRWQADPDLDLVGAFRDTFDGGVAGGGEGGPG